MQATVVTFPGGKPRQITVPGSNGVAKLSQVLDAADLTYSPEEKADLAVNGELTQDLNALVEDGATVTKTARVQAG